MEKKVADNPLSLDDLKKIELGILRYIDQVCRKYKIKYFLAYGTLLGAVRHQGFIPWDDDIDIMMFREDYNRLLEIINNDNNSCYKIISMHNNRYFFAPLAKVYDDRTVLYQNLGYVEKVITGVYVDVFIIDNCPDSIDEQTVFIKKCEDARWKWSLSCRKFRGAPSRNKFISFFKGIVSIPYKIRGYRYYLEKYEEICTSFNSQNTHFCGVLLHGEQLKDIMPNEVYNDSVELLFEGFNFFCPIGYDFYLKKMYGDYMTLPPTDKQVNKHRFKAYWKVEEWEKG